MPKLNKVMVPESTIAANRPTKDGKKHATKRILPLATLTEESAKAALVGLQEYLTTNKAILAGEECVMIRKNGTEMKATPKAADNQKEDVALLPNFGLPTTFTELFDAINNAVEAKHRNQMGAWLTNEFVEPKSGKTRAATDDGTLGDDIAVA
jgi:predicted DNA-binding transcriptional regulator YafY